MRVPQGFECIKYNRHRASQGLTRLSFVVTGNTLTAVSITIRVVSDSQTAQAALIELERELSLRWNEQKWTELN